MNMNKNLTTVSNEYPVEKDKLYEYGIVVWLETNSNDLEGITFINRIQDKVKQVKIFDDVDICIDYISSTEDGQIFFIVSDTFAKIIIPLINDIQSIDRIYIYYKNYSIDRIWDNEQYKNIAGIFDDQNFLLSIMLEHIQNYQSYNREIPKNVLQPASVAELNVVLSSWFDQNSQVPSTTTQNVLVLYNQKVDIIFQFGVLIRKLSRLPRMHLEVEHDVKNAYDKLSSPPFIYWRVVVDNCFAQEFVSQRRKMMSSRYFCAIVIVYAHIDDYDLSWAKNNPEDVWGGVAVNDEMVLKFCSGDPSARIRNMHINFLSKLDKAKALTLFNYYFNTKLPFALVVNPFADSPDSDSVRLDGSESQSRKHRFTDAFATQFVTNFRKTSIASITANLLTINNQRQDEVSTRCIFGIMCHIILNDRPIEHLRNILLKWLIPGSGSISGELSFIYYIRAYTEETFLYKDVNLALASNDQRSVRCLRDYIKTCIQAFQSKLIPFFTGTLYRGVQMTRNEITQYKVGEGIRFLGFISTSKSLEFVRFLDTNVIFIIQTLTVEQQEQLGRYTNADLHISNISVMPSEEEVLYAPFSTFNIKSIEVRENGKVTFITLEENDLSAAEHRMLNHLQEQADKGCTSDFWMTEPPLITYNL